MSSLIFRGVSKLNFVVFVIFNIRAYGLLDILVLLDLHLGSV
jgi:hypothetical protein